MNDGVDSVLLRADHALETMYATSEALTAIRVTRSSDDELVTVTVDSAGVLIGLELAPDLSRRSATHLAAVIVATASAAANEALERRQLILGQMQSALSET